MHHSAPSQTLLLAFFAAENLYGLIDTNQLQPYRADVVCAISSNRVFSLIDPRIGTCDLNLLLTEFARQDDTSLRCFQDERKFVITPICFKPKRIGYGLTEPKEIIDSVHHMTFTGVRGSNNKGQSVGKINFRICFSKAGNYQPFNRKRKHQVSSFPSDEAFDHM